MAGIDLAGLTNSWIQPGKSQQIIGIVETVDTTDFTQKHSCFERTHTRDGHNDGVLGQSDISGLGFDIIQLVIQ